MWVIIQVDGDGDIPRVRGPVNSAYDAKTFALGWASQLSAQYEHDTGNSTTMEDTGTTILIEEEESSETIWELVWKEVT